MLVRDMYIKYLARAGRAHTDLVILLHCILLTDWPELELEGVAGWGEGGHAGSRLYSGFRGVETDVVAGCCC